jgi:hypothetical protein
LRSSSGLISPSNCGEPDSSGVDLVMASLLVQ